MLLGILLIHLERERVRAEEIQSESRRGFQMEKQVLSKV